VTVRAPGFTAPDTRSRSFEHHHFRRGWKTRPLLIAGEGLVIAGYFPAVAAGAPATFGIAAAIVLIIFAAPLYLFACATIDHHGPSPNYICGTANGGIQLLLPVAGPLFFAKNHPYDEWLNPYGSELTPGEKGILIASSIAQGTGIVLVLSPLVFGSREPNASSTTSPPLTDPPAPKPHAFVVPGIARGIGLTAGFTTW
jgi:hypothetical protein